MYATDFASKTKLIVQITGQIKKKNWYNLQTSFTACGSEITIIFNRNRLRLDSLNKTW